MKTYRVAILGCRGRGEAAGQAYQAHPRTEVVALCDPVPERPEACLLSTSEAADEEESVAVATTPSVATKAEVHHLHHHDYHPNTLIPHDAPHVVTTTPH